ncbi:hypothetical protein [Haloarcula montana]|uniref:hypothetical protein n=1 Tax=Haloarcula montana TaxID=3111776 RepID=UPI002D77F840|nr:hypothetical protein [Haloarcula sp. GH36]
MLDYRRDDGAQCLDQQQELDWHRGWQVIDAVSGSNKVDPPSGGGLAVDIPSGPINAGGSTVSCASVTDFSLPAADPEQPRTDVIYRDAVGDPQYKEGEPGGIKPEGVQARDRDAAAPPPYPMHDIDGVVLATVWVPAGATSITLADIRDRRMPASLDVDQLSARSIDAGSVSSESLDTGNIDNGGSPIQFGDKLETISPNDPSEVIRMGSGRAVVGNQTILSDDSVVVLRNLAGFGIPASVLVRNNDDTEGAKFSVAGNNVSIDESDGSFAASDTDGNICVYIGGNNDLVLKNRLGSEKTMRLLAFIL